MRKQLFEIVDLKWTETNDDGWIQHHAKSPIGEFRISVRCDGCVLYCPGGCLGVGRDTVAAAKSAANAHYSELMMLGLKPVTVAELIAIAKQVETVESLRD